jgi:hypothetical protein
VKLTTSRRRDVVILRATLRAFSRDFTARFDRPSTTVAPRRPDRCIHPYGPCRFQGRKRPYKPLGRQGKLPIDRGNTILRPVCVPSALARPSAISDSEGPVKNDCTLFVLKSLSCAQSFASGPIFSAGQLPDKAPGKADAGAPDSEAGLAKFIAAAKQCRISAGAEAAGPARA